MALSTLKNAPALPAGWSWLNDTKLGEKPRWIPIPPRRAETDTWADLKARVRLMRKPWGGSPALWIQGDAAALADLATAGYATRDAAGWWIPTQAGSALLA